MTGTNDDPEDRCPWAIRLSRLATRCRFPNNLHTEHEGHGLAHFSYQRIQWFAGDKREFVTSRPDRNAWTVKPTVSDYDA